MIKHLILALLLFAPLSFAEQSVYLHTSHMFGSVIGEKVIDLEGNMPYWGTVGLTLEASDDLDVIFEAYQQSNADISSGGAEENGFRLGFTYKVCMVGC